MPGPPPKREAQRRRANKPDVPVTHAPATREVVVPEANPEWHHVAAQWYASLAGSGQSAFYESSDWTTAYAVAESMSREFKPQPLVVGRGPDATVEMYEMPPKGASLAAWLKAMSSLMVMEGDRRRVRLELDRPPAEEASADVTWIADARHRVTG